MIRVLVRCEHPEGKAAATRLRRRAREFLSALGEREAELSLSLVGDAEIRGLNRSWRGKDVATDVLSFPLAAPPRSGAMMGDVVISLDTAARVAREEGRDVGSELDRYLAHGILHLLGHDHHEAREARDMAALEERLLSARTAGRASAPATGLVSAALASRRGARSGSAANEKARGGSVPSGKARSPARRRRQAR